VIASDCDCDGMDGWDGDSHIVLMGQQLPQLNNPPLALERKHMFESQCLQRVRDTPFIDAEIYSSEPLIFIDPPGPSLAQLVRPRLGTRQLFPL
jgi:hypothetical protein